MRYSLKATGGGTGSPVSLEELKLHLRVDGDEEDSLLTSLLQTAKEKVEALTERQMMQGTFTIVFDELPVSRWRPGKPYPAAVIKLPKAPLVSVQRVAYRGTDGVERDIDPGSYTVDSASEPGRVILHDGWPVVDITRPGALTVEFTAGYENADAVPESIKAAIKLFCGHLYKHREAVIAGTIAETPLAFDALLQPFKVEGFI